MRKYYNYIINRLKWLETKDFYSCNIDLEEYNKLLSEAREIEKKLNLPPYKGAQFYYD